MGRDGSKKRQPILTYEEVRTRCLREGQPFEDPDFPANDRSLYLKKQPTVPLIWKRPREICRNPKFFSGEINRHDVAQGTLQNCWFVSALATLSQYKSLLYQVCPSHQSFDKDQYCGVFVFRFWRFGEWVEVYVDDRLPTYNGRLYFTKSNDPDEFWSALLEKAYCKMHGPYESLALGVQSEALQDFTGGVVEKITLATKPPNLFPMMMQAGERHSLMGVSITAKPGAMDQRLQNGLILGHAYSITGLKQVELVCYPDRPEVELIRIRNPWGNEAEWRGAWSDGSPEWKMLSTRQKESMGLTFEDDGEFWMSMDDFVKQFSVLEICMLKPGSVKDDSRKSWEMKKETGRWQTGLSAGGCRNFPKYFHTNPQFRVNLEEPDEDDKENRCSLVVALMRKDRNRLQRDVPIGFAVYKVSH